MARRYLLRWPISGGAGIAHAAGDVVELSDEDARRLAACIEHEVEEPAPEPKSEAPPDPEPDKGPAPESEEAKPRTRRRRS